MRCSLKIFLFTTAVVSWCATAPAQTVSESAGLERVLAAMDSAAKNFKTTEASVVWDEYQKVVNETETEKGTIYFRREGVDVEMAVDFAAPDAKYVRYTGGKVQVYLPKADEVNEYSPGKNRADVESYLVPVSYTHLPQENGGEQHQRQAEEGRWHMRGTGKFHCELVYLTMLLTSGCPPRWSAGNPVLRRYRSLTSVSYTHLHQRL